MMNYYKTNLQFRFEVISDLCSFEPQTYTTNRLAARALNLCKRQIQRLKKQFDGTLESLQHGNTGKTKEGKYPQELQKNIVQTVKDWNNVLEELKQPYLQYTFAYFKIVQQYKTTMSYSYFQKLMKDNGIFSPRSHAKETDTGCMHLKSKKKYKPGEEWQADGTFDFKLAGDETSYCAHVIVDRGSKLIIACYLDYQETTQGYLNCFKQAFEEYGYPQMITTDKRTSFENTSSGKDALTCLGKIFGSLDIAMRLTSNPRSKNSVEAKNAIIKTHVMSELALSGVKTLEEANSALPNIIKFVNQSLNNQLDDENLHKPLPKGYNYDLIFSRMETRKLTKQNIISYKGIEYFLHDSIGQIYKPKTKKKVNVHTSYSGEVFAMVGNKKYKLIEAYRENLLNFETQECSSIKRHIKPDGYTLAWKKRDYHLIDNTGVAVHFDWKDEVKLYYTYKNGKYTANIAEVNGIKYQIKLGQPTQIEDNYETELYFTTNSQVITKNAVYALYSDRNIEVTLEKDAHIFVEIKNGTPTSGILNNHKYKLINTTTC